MDSSAASIALRVLAVFAIVAANGLFAAAEFAVAKSRKTRLASLVKRKVRFARVVQRAAEDPEAFVAATQLGITMTSLGLGWIGEPVVARLITPLLAAIPSPWPDVTSYAVSATLAFILITALHIVLGELVPKSLALRNAEAIALMVVPPVVAFSRVFKPFIWLLDMIADRTLHLFGLRAPPGRHVAFEREELVMLVSESRRAGTVDREEESLVRRVFRLTDRTVGEVMVHRMNVAGVPQTATVEDAVAIIRDRGFSRLPVFGGSQEEIIGAVRAKDLLLEVAAGRGGHPVTNVMRPVLYVPETKPVVDLLEEMRRGRSQLAVVLEEYGSIAGIVTIEDLLEEIVGEIPGESRPQPKLIHIQQPDRVVVDAAIDLQTLNDLLGITLSGEQATTLGGFIFYHLGTIPEPGTKFSVGKLEFSVETVVGRRIGRVEIRRKDR